MEVAKKRKPFKRRPKTEEEKQRLRDIAKAKWQDPEYQAKFNEGYSKVRSSLPERIKASSSKISEKVQASWTNEKKQRVSKIFQESWSKDSGRKEAASSRMRRVWQDSEVAESRKRAIASARGTKEARLAASKHATDMWSSTSHREIISSATKKAWSDPLYRARVLARTSAQQRPNIVRSIIEDLSSGKGTVSGLCTKSNFSHTTMLRILRSSNLSHLVDSSTTASTPQIEIFNFVKSLAPDAVLNTRKVIAPKELDIYIPSKNFAVEFNGLYWHSSAADIKSGSHYEKAKMCEDKGISLLAVFEDEWLSKRSLIETMIKHRLGVSEGTKVYAKDTSVVELSAKDCKDFHDKYHLDGGLFYKGYGLAVDGELVAAMSLRKYTSKPYNGFTEIARFAVSSDYVVVGAMGKLLSRVEGNIVSYSNNRLSVGAVYKQLGFVEDTKSCSPSYWYTDFNTRVFRTRCKRINDPEILSRYPTETSQAENGIFSIKIFNDDRPLYRVEDYGHKRWILMRSV